MDDEGYERLWKGCAEERKWYEDMYARGAKWENGRLVLPDQEKDGEKK